MVLNPVFKAKNYQDMPIFLNEEQVRGYLKTLPKEFDVVFKKPSSGRSQQQNKYYWGVVVHLLSEHLGYTPEETHDVIKNEFLKEVVMREINGETKEIINIKSTTELNIKDMQQFLEFVRMWAMQEFGVDIPEPSEVEYDQR